MRARMHRPLLFRDLNNTLRFQQRMSFSHSQECENVHTIVLPSRISGGDAPLPVARRDSTSPGGSWRETFMFVDIHIYKTEARKERDDLPSAIK